MELSKVVRFLTRFAPVELAESWDNVGLLLEPSSCLVKKVLLTNDLTEKVFDEAVSQNANMIISYHPPIFSSFKRLTQQRWKDRIVIGCLERKIALYSPHTSWDHVRGGVNDWLGDAFKNYQPRSTYIAPHSLQGIEAGIGRVLGLPNAISLEDAMSAVKTHLNLPFIRVAKPDVGRPISRIALCAGAGAGVFDMGKYSDYDLVLTGEMSHHQVLDATAAGCSVFLCEHSNTERGFLKSFKEILSKEFPDVEAVVSTTDHDPLVVQ